MRRRKLTIGTRGSELARWQTDYISQRLRSLDPELEVEIVVIKTTGDKILDSPLAKIGDKGLFTKEIEKALQDGAIDLAVHSLKDVPTVLPEGLEIGAVTEREDIRDVFISNPRKNYANLQDIPTGGSIATGSLRRKCQLLNLRPDLTVADIRGSLRTRREKLELSDWDGMILAMAGIKRLGWVDIVSEVFSPEIMLPAVGQGALAVEVRATDTQLKDFIYPLNHAETQLATQGERALLRRLEGGCQIPIGTFGRIDGKTFRLDAMVGTLDGKNVVRGSIAGTPSDADKLGTELAEQLLMRGADKILEKIRRSSEGRHFGSPSSVV